MREIAQIEQRIRLAILWPLCCGTVVLAVFLYRLLAGGVVVWPTALCVALLYGFSGALWWRKRQIDRELAPIKRQIAALERRIEAARRLRGEGG